MAKHAEVHRVIDLTTDPPTDRLVINLTDAPFSPDPPARPDGPPREVVFVPPNGRQDLLPAVGRARHAAKHAKNRLAELRRRIGDHAHFGHPK